MINWYKSKDLDINFNDVPYVSIRYALPSMTDSELKSIKKYPFINKRDLTVRIIYHKDNDRTHEFTIPKNYCFDGASIPRLFWRIIGAPTDNSFLIAAIVHDYLCEHHALIMNDRELSTEVFNALLETSKVGKFKRFLMKTSVDIFQKFFCDWGLEYNK